MDKKKFVHQSSIKFILLSWVYTVMYLYILSHFCVEIILSEISWCNSDMVSSLWKLLICHLIDFLWSM
jgi:hypothetical protein